MPIIAPKDNNMFTKHSWHRLHDAQMPGGDGVMRNFGKWFEKVVLVGNATDRCAPMTSQNIRHQSSLRLLPEQTIYAVFHIFSAGDNMYY